MSEMPEWRVRLEAGIADLVCQRAAKAAMRAELDAARGPGLARRHQQRLGRKDAVVNASPPAGIGPCRYLVADEPPLQCPNERVPGGALCRPHLAQAAALAERIGLVAVPPCCVGADDPCPQHRQAARVVRRQGPRSRSGGAQLAIGEPGKAKPARGAGKAVRSPDP